MLNMSDLNVWELVTENKEIGIFEGNYICALIMHHFKLRVYKSKFRDSTVFMDISVEPVQRAQTQS